MNGGSDAFFTLLAVSKLIVQLREELRQLDNVQEDNMSLRKLLRLGNLHPQRILSQVIQDQVTVTRSAKRAKTGNTETSWIDHLPVGSANYFTAADTGLALDQFALASQSEHAQDWFNSVLIPNVALPILRAIAADNGATTRKDTLEFWLFRGGNPSVAGKTIYYTEHSPLRTAWLAEATSENAKRARRNTVYEILKAAQRGRDAALEITVKSVQRRPCCLLAHDDVLGPLFAQLIATHMHEASALYPKARVNQRQAQLRERNYEMNEIIWRFCAAFGHAPYIDPSMRSTY